MKSHVDALLRQAGELLRQRAELAAQLKALDADIGTLKRAADILQPVAVCAASRNNEARAGKAGRPSGSLTTAMLEVLRDAPEPLTAAGIGSLALAHIGEPPAAIGRSALTSRATTALKKYSDRGTVLRIESADGPLRWCIAR